MVDRHLKWLLHSESWKPFHGSQNFTFDSLKATHYVTIDKLNCLSVFSVYPSKFKNWMCILCTYLWIHPHIKIDVHTSMLAQFSSVQYDAVWKRTEFTLYAISLNNQHI